MSTITKRDLVLQISEQISERSHMTQFEVMEVIQLFINNITRHLARNDDVVLRNFGTFEIQVTQPKVGRNPNNPAHAVPIPARTVVKFKPGKEMKEKVATTLQVIRERKA